MRRTGVGVVGTGFAAQAHLDALRRLPDVDIVAIAGHDAGRTRELAGRHGARPYAGHEELLDDPAVEAVHTCTTNALHYAVNLAALQAGRHVMSEKPLASTSDESGRLAAEAAPAAERGVLSGVCFNYRHYPLVAQIRELLRTGDYGRPHFAHGRYLQDWLLLQTDWSWRVAEAGSRSSRAVADIGSHWADLVQHVTGDEIVEVLADLGTLHAERIRPADVRGTFASGADASGERVAVDSEDFASVMLRFASGARGSFVVSQTSAGHKNGLAFEIDTDRAAFAWEQESPDRAWVGRRPGPNLQLLRDPSAMLPRAARLARLPAGHGEGWFDALRNLLADFYGGVAALRDGRAPDVDVATFADGHARVELVEAVVASHREQTWTAVRAGRDVTA